MHTETERKFLVTDDSFISQAVESHHLIQGYICRESGRTVRVRTWDDTGYLTIKGPSFDGISRLEWEKEIPLEEARVLMGLCIDGIIDKTRFIVPAGDGLKWEVDIFHGDNEGLKMAEIELPDPDTPYKKTSWLGEEVTRDRRYYNAALSGHPYKEWGL